MHPDSSPPPSRLRGETPIRNEIVDIQGTHLSSAISSSVALRGSIVETRLNTGEWVVVVVGGRGSGGDWGLNRQITACRHEVMPDVPAVPDPRNRDHEPNRRLKVVGGSSSSRQGHRVRPPNVYVIQATSQCNVGVLAESGGETLVQSRELNVQAQGRRSHEGSK